MAFFGPDAFDAEVGIDQDQAFNAEILKLQVPDRVGRCDGSDLAKVHALREFISVIVVEIRHAAALFRTASVLADIMQDRGAAHQGRIHPDTRAPELLCQVDGHKAHAGDMTECLIACDMPMQAHERIQIPLLQNLQKSEVSCAVLISPRLVRIQKHQAPRTVLSKKRFLARKKLIQDIQVEQDRLTPLLPQGRLLPAGIKILKQPGTDILIPVVPFFRTGAAAQLLQLRLHHIGNERDIRPIPSDRNGRGRCKDLFFSFCMIHVTPHKVVSGSSANNTRCSACISWIRRQERSVIS